MRNTLKNEIEDLRCEISTHEETIERLQDKIQTRADCIRCRTVADSIPLISKIRAEGHSSYSSRIILIDNSLNPIST